MDEPELRRRADLRYRGQSFELTVEADDLGALEDRFGEAHERRYGYRMDGEGIELVNARLIATQPVERPELSEAEPDGEADAGTRKANFDGDWQEVPVLRRGGMGEGTGGRPGDRRVRRGDLRRAPRLVGRGRRVGDARARARRRVSLDPVTLSVLASALSGIAEEAGALLIRGAYSSNIKERRDCSAALFDAEGRMVAQAEHIPVHLGAMPEAVAAVIEREPEPGDVWILNDPYRGGTHLPDVTLVSPLDVDERHPRLRGHARAPLRRRRDAPRLDAGRLARHLAGGDRDPAAAPRRRRAGADPRQRPHARHPPRRPARPDRSQPPGRPAPGGARRSPRSRDDRAGLRGGHRLRRAAHARGAARRARRYLRGRALARGRRRLRRRRADRGRRHGRRRRTARSTSPAPTTRWRATSTARCR